MRGFAVLLCIENRIYREGLQKALSDCPEIAKVHLCDRVEQIGAPAPDGAEAILVDIGTGTARGAAAGVRTAFARAAGRPVIALGLDDCDSALLASVEAGAAACVTCDQSIGDLVKIVQSTLKGDLVCPPRIGRLLQERLLTLTEPAPKAQRLTHLSQREQHVLSHLTDCLSNKQIARKLGLEVSTIKNHVHNIIVKLSVRNRAEAAALMRSPEASLARIAPDLRN